MARILLIDDTPEIAELLTFALRDLGHTLSASGYTPGVNALVDENSAEALVLDCSAYEMSEALFDAVRADAKHAGLPIVIISDTPEKADSSLAARNAENVLLIPKPFTASQIARAINQLLTT